MENKTQLREVRIITNKETEVLLVGGKVVESAKNTAAVATPVESNENAAVSKASKQGSEVLESPPPLKDRCPTNSQRCQRHYQVESLSGRINA